MSKESLVDKGKAKIEYLWENREGMRERPEFGMYGAVSILVILTIIEFLLPISGSRVTWYGNIFAFTCIFIIMAIGLNLHTGMAGMVNFGVIFFVGIGAVTTGILSVKLGWNPFVTMLIGVIIGSAFGYLMIYPTVRLRTDYFAIVTIALGEILKLFLTVEPTLRASANVTKLTNLGINDITRPFESWWASHYGINSSHGLPYVLVICLLGLIMVSITFLIAQLAINSPFGRVMKGIREDDEVVESYGYDVLRYKGIILAIGAGIMSFAGSLWAWYQGSIFPDFMDPVRSTFLVWAVFIIGGKANNWGMLVGSYFIVLLDFRLRVLNSVGGLNINFLRFVIIGAIIILTMRFAKTGIIPEVPYRPEVSGYESTSKVFDVVNCQHCGALNRNDAEMCDSCGKTIIEEASK